MLFKSLIGGFRKAYSGSSPDQRSDVGDIGSGVDPKPFDADDIPIPVGVFDIRRDAIGTYLAPGGGQPVLLLNETGLQLWRLCDDIKSVRMIMAAFGRSYDGDETVLENDVLTALLAFERNGYLRRGRVPEKPTRSDGTEVRHKVHGIGWTFRPIWSSNSCRKPVRFDWTPRRVEATIPITICLGHEIPRGLKLPGRKIAWLIESPALSQKQGIYRFIEDKLDQVVEAFELILTPDRSMCALDPKFRYHPAGSNLPWIAIEDYRIYPKTKLCSMIASEKTMFDGHHVRQEYARKLKRADPESCLVG